jgi:hypothetical protein
MHKTPSNLKRLSLFNFPAFPEIEPLEMVKPAIT